MSINRFNIDSFETELSLGVTVLVPSHRIVDAIQTSYGNRLKHNKRSWLRPNVFAIDIWLQELWQQLSAQGIMPFASMLILSKHQEMFAWQNIIESSVNDIPLLNLQATAKSASHAYHLCRQWIVTEQEREKLASHSSNTDVNAFLNWSRQFKTSCAEKHLISLSDACYQLINYLKDGGSLKEREILLVDFLNPPPLYALLFETIAANTKLSSAPAPSEKDSPNSEQRVFHEFIDEAKACAAWSRELIAANPHCHIGVINNKLDQYRSDLDRAFNQDFFAHKATDLGHSELPYNIFSASMSSLENKSLIQQGLQILELNRAKISSQGFCELLQFSSLIAYEEELAARINAQLYLRNNYESNCRPADMRWLLQQGDKDYHCPILAAALQEFEQLKRTSQQTHKHSANAQTWATLFSQQLDSVGWPGQLQGEEEKTYKLWQLALQNFTEAGNVLGSMTLTTALGKLRTLCASTTINPVFDAHKNISVLKPEEALGLQFDHIWLMAMDDKSWPSNASPNAFLPFSLQLELAMPGSSSVWQYHNDQNNLRQLAQHSQHSMVYSFHKNANESPLRGSQLVEQWHAEPEASPLLTAAVSDTTVTELINDDSALALESQETIRGGSSLLSNQSKCPFKAFASHRLKVKALTEFESGLNALARGNALHIALEQLGQLLPSSSQLQASMSEDISQNISVAVASAITFLRRRYPDTMSPNYCQLETIRLERLLHSFIALEQQRSPFSIYATEQKTQWSQGLLTLSLSIDRIDRLDDGSLVLIDYKSGKQLNYKWFDERPDDLQLPLYFSATDAPDNTIEAIVIAQVNSQKLQYLGVSNSADLMPKLKALSQQRDFSGDWQELEQLWKNTVSNIAREFEQGRCQVMPNKASSCQYCQLSSLCRINEGLISAATHNPIDVDLKGINS